MSLHVFFFQAEDGIRDLTVTGVQTCAFRSPPPSPARGLIVPRLDWAEECSRRQRIQVQLLTRSEERRVGKECRSRWSLYHLAERRRLTRCVLRRTRLVVIDGCMWTYVTMRV